MRTMVAHVEAAPARRAKLARAAVAGGLFLLAAPLTSCSLMLEPDKTQCTEDKQCLDRFGEDSDLFCRQNVCVSPSCKKDADCAKFGSSYEGTICVDEACVEPAPTSTEPPEWLCLDEPAAAASTEPGPFQVKLHLQHMVSQMPMKMVMARVCRKLDVNCDSPESAAMSDDNGDVVVPIPKGFTGYVALSREGLMPTQYFFNPAIAQDTDLGNVQLVEPATAKGLSLRAGAALQEGRGLVLFAAYNCALTTVAGIKFASSDADPSTTTFYSSGGLPSSTVSETEASGFGGFINAAAGIFSIEGQRSSDGRISGRVSVLVKANELTITRLVPSLL